MKKMWGLLKIQLKWKDMLLWFGISFAGVLLVFTIIQGRALSNEVIIETFGFAVVFVLLMIGTKAYGQFVNGYYEGIKRRKGYSK